MCGIAGEYSFSEPVSPVNIEKMITAISHRGPDDEGVFCEGFVGLGHRRLSIIDLSPAGHQPMWTEDKSLCIVFNGEIYNYHEIRPDLEVAGYHFKSNSDTEVVINAIHCWGIEAALNKFIGMFAFAVLNVPERCLFLARDRAGIKPLFYFKDDKRLIFGSELRVLYSHTAYTKNLDKRGLGQYFILGYTLSEKTVLAGTKRLPAGHYMICKADGSIIINKYWGIDCIERGSFHGSYQEALDEMERLATNAFCYRLVSDVPVAVFLSGGIDSTFLSAILKKKTNADLLHITIGFDDKHYDEAPVASRIAKELGLRHEIRYLKAPEAVDALRRFNEIYDEPFGDSSGMPTALLCAVAREYVKVALSADGGDEQFCGYESYPQYANRYLQMAKIPYYLRSIFVKIFSLLPYEKIISWHLNKKGENRRNPRLISTVEKGLEVALSSEPDDILRIMNEKGWTEKKVSALIGENIDDLLSDVVLASRYTGSDKVDAFSLIDDMMRADYQSFLRDDILTKVDRASMAVSLECRDPFLDHRIAEFAYSLPLEFVYKNGEHKHLLKDILRRWISESVLNLPKKGFSIPLYEWMRGPWKALVDEYLSKESIRKVGVLDECIVSSEVERFYRYRGIGAEKLQLLLNFQMWAERWLN